MQKGRRVAAAVQSVGINGDPLRATRQYIYFDEPKISSRARILARGFEVLPSLLIDLDCIYMRYLAVVYRYVVADARVHVA